MISTKSPVCVLFSGVISCLPKMPEESQPPLQCCRAGCPGLASQTLRAASRGRRRQGPASWHGGRLAEQGPTLQGGAETEGHPRASRQPLLSRLASPEPRRVAGCLLHATHSRLPVRWLKWPEGVSLSSGQKLLGQEGPQPISGALLSFHRVLRLPLSLNLTRVSRGNGKRFHHRQPGQEWKLSEMPILLPAPPQLSTRRVPRVPTAHQRVLSLLSTLSCGHQMQPGSSRFQNQIRDWVMSRGERSRTSNTYWVLYVCEGSCHARRLRRSPEI